MQNIANGCDYRPHTVLIATAQNARAWLARVTPSTLSVLFVLSVSGDATGYAAPARPADSTLRAGSGPVMRVELRVRVARCDGRPVRSRAWVERHLAEAEAIYRPHGIHLAPTIEPFTPDRCELLDAADRHAMAVHVDRPQVTVLVVKRVRDLDLPTYDLMGVHWRYRGKSYAGRRWVFLTARARPPVLAHELGHYFGLRHDRAGGNLMSPGPSDPIWRRPGKKPRAFVPRFAPRQVRRLRRAVRRLTETANQRK